MHRHLSSIQFVDGDCELDAEWIGRGTREILASRDLAIVCGVLRERHPDASIYNRLCDMEWKRPIGEVDACGGIFLVRVEAFADVGGFDAAIAAGEEPELCARLRHRGWTIRRVDAHMAVHDAGMLHFRQWWQRAIRSGYGTAHSAWRPSPASRVEALRGVASIVLWSAGIMSLAVLLAWPTGGWSLLVLAAYPMQWYRIWLIRRAQQFSMRDAAISATFTLIAKAAELVGLLKFAGEGIVRNFRESGGHSRDQDRKALPERQMTGVPVHRHF